MHILLFLAKINFFALFQTHFDLSYLYYFVNNVFVDILDPGCYGLTKTSTTPAEVTKSTNNQVTHTPTYNAVAGNILSDVSSTGSDM